MRDEGTADQTRTPVLEVRGIGHPNKILQRDYGGLPLAQSEPGWVARVETYVFVDEKDYETVRKGFRGGSQADKDAAAKVLFDAVPTRGKDPEAAKKMIAAAIGTDYPFTKPNDKTAGQVETIVSRETTT
jgi:hypothetical protein